MVTFIIGGGKVDFIYSDAAAAMARVLGAADTRRASHVEPEGEKWIADLAPVGGPKLGAFDTRAEALAAEVAYLEQWLKS